MLFEEQCGDYKILQHLGEGGFGQVKLGCKDGQIVAIKIVKENQFTSQTIQSFKNEFHILQQLSHPNIIKLKDYQFYDALPYTEQNGQTSSRICIIMEFAQGGELFEYINQCGALSEEIARFYFRQLLESMMYMANKGVCHRDLKLDNLLLDENFNLKVCDFGLAKLMEAATTSGKSGTPQYQAPEVKMGIPYNGTKADIYSAGVILFLLILGDYPIKNNNQQDWHFRQWEEEQVYKTNGEYQRVISIDLIDLIDGMLAYNPEIRFTLDQCMQHPWTQGLMPQQKNIKLNLRIRFRTISKKKHKKITQRRSTQKDEQEDEQEGIVDEICEQYELNFTYRDFRKGQLLNFPNAITLSTDPKFIFCYLIKHCQKFNSKVSGIEKDKYKINFRAINEENGLLEFSIELLDCDNEMLELNIYKSSGDYLQFKQIQKRIQDMIKELYQDDLQEGIKQQ